MQVFRKILVAGGALLLAVPAAMAQKAGDNIGAVGIAVIIPQESLGPLNAVGPAAPKFNPALAGATASIDPVATLSFSLLHMFTDNIGAELSLGIPPKFTVDVQLTSGAHPGAATAKELTPALVGKYFFATAADRWRPYVGLGISYASFSNVQANMSDPLVANLAGTSASLSSSWNPVYNAGVIYNINERVSINASVSYLPVKTDVTFVGSGTTTTGTLKLNPIDVIVRLGYKF